MPAVFRHPTEFVTFKTSPHLPGVELYSARLVDHSFAPHVHEAYSIGAVEAGAERFRYQGSDHVASVGALMLLNPDEMHTGQAEAAEGWTYQMMYIEPDTLLALTGSEAWFPQVTVHDPALAAAYRQAFRHMWQAGDDVDFVSGFTTLLDRIVARHGRQAHAATPPDARKLRRAQAMQRVLDTIEGHLDQPLKLEQLAAEAGLSLFHFVRSFTELYHATPHQYVQARRAARAKQMLAQRSTPSDAAAAVGLTDQSHLNRWFKRAYGVTPAQYQQQIGTRPDMAARA